MKKLGKKLNLIVCGIAFIIMIVYLFVFDKPEKVFNAMRAINPWFIVLGVMFMVGYWLCEALTVHSMLKPMQKDVKFYYSWLDTIIGQYFNCITPFASGGQPMQTYYFVKFGVPLGNTLTALLSRFIVYQFVLTLYSVFTLVIGIGQFGDDLMSKGLMPFVIIGFVVNTFVIIFLLGIAIWRKGTVKFLNAVISLLAKMRIVKNPMKHRVYFTREVEKFHTNFMFLKNNIPAIIKSCIFTFIQLSLFLSITYVLYMGFGLEGSGLLQILSYQAFVLMISSFIPLPGAMGAAELGFAGFFGDIFGEFTGTAMMLWRIFTFYLPIIVGMTFTLTLKSKGIDEPTKLEAGEHIYNAEQDMINNNNKEE